MVRFGMSIFKATKSVAVDYLETPVGRIRIVVSPRGLVAIDLPGHPPRELNRLLPDAERELPVTGADARTRIVTKQLAEYFAGKRKAFDLPLAPHGAEFDQKVWARVAKIPYAAVMTYGDVARDIDHPKAFRAVGAANGRNPIPLVIPCHRVVGAGCRLTGFGGGLPLKAKLLEREGLVVSDKKATASSKVLFSGG
jgi:methylated-DNA-[protein]-cysteine S-methyltransferase